jgi:hypothetical protein
MLVFHAVVRPSERCITPATHGRIAFFVWLTFEDGYSDWHCCASPHASLNRSSICDKAQRFEQHSTAHRTFRERPSFAIEQVNVHRIAFRITA